MKKTFTKINLLIGAGLLCSSAFGQWVPQSTGFKTSLRGVSAIAVPNANVAWVAANNVNRVNSPIQDFAKTTNGGATWTTGTISVKKVLNFCNIEALDSSTAWVAMYDTVAGARGGGVYKTSDGGKTWKNLTDTTTQFVGAAAFPDFVHFFDANNGVVVGDPNGGSFEIYTTSNGGATWTRVPATNIPANLAGEYGTVNVYSYVTNTVWFGSTKGRMYKSTDKGNTWTVANTGATALNSVAFSDASNGLAENYNSGNILLYKSADGGSTWTPVVPTGPIFSYVNAVPGSLGMYVCSGYTGKYNGSSYSTDYGNTWTMLDSANYHSISVFLNSNVAYSGAYNYSTTEHGIYKWTGICSQKAAITYSGKDTACASGTPVTLNATTGAGLTYQWYKNGLAINGATNSTYNANGGAYYNVIINTGACKRISYPVPVYVLTAPIVTVNASTTYICAGQTITLSGTATPSNTVTYQWQKNGNIIAGATTTTYNTNTTGTYTMIATNSAGCNGSGNVIITDVTPSAKFGYTLSGKSITVKDSSNNAISYKWYFGDGAVSNVQNPAAHSYASKGSYTVCLTIKNVCGDSSRICKSITISGIHDLINNSTYRVYPIPVSSNLIIEMELNNPAQLGIEITDLLGKTMLKMNKVPANGSFQQDIDVSSLSQGVYLLKVSTDEGTHIVQKFVKQ